MLQRPWLVLIVPILTILLLVAYTGWRWPAPPFEGQSLRVEIPVSENFELILVGDTGLGSPSQQAVAEAMNKYCQEHPLAAVILLGDNFYMRGVESTEDPQWKDKFQDIYNKDCLAKVPFYALLGNHDYKGNPAAQIAYKGGSPAWNMPHRFYEIAFGQRLQLIMSDSNIPDFCGSVQDCSLDFMMDALKRGDYKDRLVLGHHPIFSASIKYNKQEFRGRVLKHLLCEKADSYISGHAHHLEHRQFPGCRLDAFISGAGGAELTGVNADDPNSYFGRSAHGFLTLEVRPESLRYTFRNEFLDGLYSYTRKSD